MSFEKYFIQQLQNHPSMQFSDVAKLCYQAAFGAEHLLVDVERVRACLYCEFETILPTNEPLFEYISPDIVRVNLGAWKREDKSIDALFEAFIRSAQIETNSKNDFLSYIDLAECVMKENKSDFNINDWKNFLEEYKKAGMSAVHHSELYREKEKPSYRVVKIKELEDIL